MLNSSARAALRLQHAPAGPPRGAVWSTGVIDGHLEFCRFGQGGASQEQRHRVHEESCRGVLVDATARRSPAHTLRTRNPLRSLTGRVTGRGGGCPRLSLTLSATAATPQGRTVFTCSTDKSICAFDLATGTVAARLENAHKEGINRMCFVSEAVLATGARRRVDRDAAAECLRSPAPAVC